MNMRNSFWETWRKEVLHQLIQTNKWRFPQRNLEIGDIVILTDEDTPPAYWPLGRLRVVTVKTANSTYIWAVNKLIYLPVENQATQAHFTLLERVLVATWCLISQKV